jgi:hypothetical protein
MIDIDSETINIRHRVRAHHLRQLKVAALAAPADWQAALRDALVAERKPVPLIVSTADLKLFLQSFTVFFVTLMVFLY